MLSDVCYIRHPKPSALDHLKGIFPLARACEHLHPEALVEELGGAWKAAEGLRFRGSVFPVYRVAQMWEFSSIMPI